MSDEENMVHREGATIPSLLKYWSTVEPETPAYIFVRKDAKTVLSRSDVFTMSGKMATRLRRIGVQKGDVVANMLPNSVERLVSEFGILMAGGVSQTAFGYLNNADDTSGALEIAQTTTVIADPGMLSIFNVIEKLFSKKSRTDYGLEVKCPHLPHLKRVVFMDIRNDSETRRDLGLEKETFMADLRPSDFAVIVETSGTTGICKQVPHTHSSILRFGEQMCYLIGENGSPYYNDRFFGWFPGYPCIYPCSGITRVSMDARENDLPTILDIIKQERCKSAYLVPSEIEEVIESIEKEPLNVVEDMSVVLTGGQPIARRTMRIIGRLTEKVVCRYGMSEAMCICHLVVKRPEEFQDHCVGFPMPSYKIRVVDEDGEDVLEGQRGDIIVKGDGVFKGYMYRALNNESTHQGQLHRCQSQNDCPYKCGILKRRNSQVGDLAIDEFTADGWFRTGDIGFLDPLGRLFVDGRGSDAIMHGDEILYPHWLEKLARKCPAVDDIAIVPVKDPVLCHEICACVKPVGNFENVLDEVKAFFGAQLAIVPQEECSILPKFYLLFDAFPVNKNRKLVRKELTRLAEERLQIKS